MKQADRLLTALGGIGDDLVLEDDRPAAAPRRRRRLAVAACLTLALFGLLAVFLLSGSRRTAGDLCIVNGRVSRAEQAPSQTRFSPAGLLGRIFPGAEGDSALDRAAALLREERDGKPVEAAVVSAAPGQEAADAHAVSEGYSVYTLKEPHAGTYLMVTLRSSLERFLPMQEALADVFRFDAAPVGVSVEGTALPPEKAEEALGLLLAASPAGYVFDALARSEVDVGLDRQRGRCFEIQLRNAAGQTLYLYYYRAEDAAATGCCLAFSLGPGAERLCELWKETVPAFSKEGRP